jgi:hypothetical protein
MYVLALAALGSATQSRTNPICVMLPKEAKEVGGQHHIAIQPQQTSPMYVLALATLGSATQSRTNPICVVLPKEVKASRGGNITSRYSPNKLRQSIQAWTQKVFKVPPHLSSSISLKCNTRL